MRRSRRGFRRRIVPLCCRQLVCEADKYRPPVQWSERQTDTSANTEGKGQHLSYPERLNILGVELPDLLFEHFFDLSDFFLNFAGVFFGVAFGL